MSPERLKIIQYVNTASDLAETLTRNLKSKKRSIDDKTVVALGKFYKAAKDIQYLLDVIEQDNKEIN